MSIFDRERSEIAKLFSEELELGLYSLSSEATYRVISVDGIPAQHTILISCYNDEVYLPFESRSNTNRLTVTDLDYDVRYGQVVNHANIDMRVLNDGMNAENYNSDIYIPSNTKVSLRDLLIRAYQLGGYGSRHDLLNSNEITEEEARMAVAEAVGALTSNEAEPSMQTDKDIRLDTPQAVKEALASGKDLYNPQTGEFWWEYNYTGSITDSIETIIEDGEENAPLIDPRDEVFAQIASEKGWVVATPENVRKAVQSHMAENGADAPGKENGMDKTAEIAAWKEKHVPIDRNGDDALVMHKMADGKREFIVAHGYDEETGHWGHGTYYDSLASAAADLEDRAISNPGEEVICPDFWYRADIESALENAGLEVNDANVNATLKELGFDNGWLNSNFHDRLAEMGNEMIADAVDNIEPNGGDGDSPEAFVDRGISLKAEAESMRRASQALSADGSVDEREPSFTPDLS